MQHTWNEDTDTCERCGLVKKTKKRKQLINTRYSATYDQYYTVYYFNGELLGEVRPDCFHPNQLKLNFES